LTNSVVEFALAHESTFVEQGRRSSKGKPSSPVTHPTVPGNGTGLTFPKKDEWPKVTAEEWVDDERSALLRLKILSTSIFAGVDFTVGSDSYTGDWALIYDEAECKAHASYPAPTSAFRRRLHRMSTAIRTASACIFSGLSRITVCHGRSGLNECSSQI